MAKGIIGGMTDYSHQSFKDIIEDLEKELQRTKSFREVINNNLKTVAESGYWENKVASDFRDEVVYAIRHYNTTIEELTDINEDVVLEVKDHHVKRLFAIAKVAYEINKSIGWAWHNQYPGREYGNPEFRIVEKIYNNTRDMAVNLTDIENIAERLKDFIGKSKMVSPQLKVSKWPSWVTPAIVISCGSLLVALLVLFFGNNWVGRMLERPDEKKSLIPVTMKISHVKSAAIDSFTLSYLETKAILNKTLFLKYNYNDLIIGGVNAPELEIGARNQNGAKLEINRRNDELSVDIGSEPYIEFKLLDKYYSIDCTGTHYSFKIKIIHLPAATFVLKKSNRLD